ncbi:hypothetical protein A2690_02695 [Candidatus Roizmanbacteria bacterium RIFCSPHIGHO2_01_FULL_39_12b]|uniref:Uncharacterized protein n=1 Tax=Candidatus Roizmanbacteria bacterium RIFCSPHIGHO2_01_FULL_39_12b TaxID=1802030 RepID=A0A1F7GBG4_9BACT|nr:MAG: hypothetical protein A2690_02695 [Candidatus Roizmanbacteria bacterium RIFCSPHIGHO2_01_FULL_39_12b]
MNYTPLPPEALAEGSLPKSVTNDTPQEHQEAPMYASSTFGEASVGGGGNNKALLVGIVVVLMVAMGVLGFSIIKRQKTSAPVSEIVPSPTSEVRLIEEVTPIIVEAEGSESAILSPIPTKEVGSDLSPTLIPTTPLSVSPTTIVNQPELPRAGASLPLLVVSFLGLFILLIAFAL